MSKKSSDPLTRVFEKCPTTLTISTVVHEGGQIVVRPLLVTGPFRLFVMDGPELPPELLERLIFLPNEPEDAPCR